MSASFTTVSVAPNFDGAWKAALQAWLRECLALFWPNIHEAIDWRHAPVYLDKELKLLGRFVKTGERHLDLLAEVRLKAGGTALLLIHLEVQAGRITAAFSARMLHYHVYLRHRHPGRDILSCAILLDRKNGPDRATFQSCTLGCELTFHFPVLNLAAWRHRMAELEALAPVNPFAVVVLAQLACRATRPNSTRLASKLRLARALSAWNYGIDTRKSLILIIDALLALPEALDELFIEGLEHIEDPIMMQELNSFQRVRLKREKAASLEEGIQKGLRKGERESASTILTTLLQQKFGPLPEWAAMRLAKARTATLQRWALKVLDAGTIEEVFGR